MSLFDVIRHPISTPPTEAELAGLPSGVLNIWAYTVAGRFFTIETKDIVYQFVRENPKEMSAMLHARWGTDERNDDRVRASIRELRDILLHLEDIIKQ